ncbi:MAG TPA: malonic semialdehyde reductase [Candidatus Sulfotelmatobacter sp.]|nr:malonic semialdehyde reductase [Candidatus Sulfotelmatobacter sp.]
MTTTLPELDELIARKGARTVDEHALRSLFLDARTANGFLDVPVPRALLERAVELAKHGPTGANAQPMRLVFVESPEAKQRLLPALAPGNVEKTKSAPVTAIVAADHRFYEHLPRLFPHAPQMKAMYEGDDKAALVEQQATLNATLQGAYFMLAARSLGLDVGPMGGFDRAQVDATFFPDGRSKSLWLVNLGYADDGKTFARSPRLEFDEIATIV